MYTRDVLVQAAFSYDEFCNTVLNLLKHSGKLTQSGHTEGESSSFYVVQPEEILVMIPPPEDGTFSVHIQPYNLPDPMDQERMIQSFPDELVDLFAESHPEWQVQLQPILLV